MNASEPHPGFVLLQLHSEAGYLTAVYKNVHFIALRTPDKVMLGTKLAFFLFVSTLTYFIF